jgi:hypothetical protein
MEVILMIPAHEIIHDEHSRVHEWIAALVQRGCPPWLALRIVL